MKRASALVPVILLLTACAGGAPPAPPAPVVVDRSGEYTVMIDAQGQSIDGVLIISGGPGAYGGSIDTSMGGAAISSVSVDGDAMTFSVDEVGVTFNVVFDGEAFAGDFSGSIGAGSITGLKTSGDD